MNWPLILSKIRKLLLTGLCILSLTGGLVLASGKAMSQSAIAASFSASGQSKPAPRSKPSSPPPGLYDRPGIAQPNAPAGPDYQYSPYAGKDFPQQVYWGDTHHHTVYSYDAGAAGTRLTPEQSYRFARGEEVTTNTGQRAKLSRPLDFLVVTDHTDGLGAFQAFLEAIPPACDGDPQYDQIAEWQQQVQNGGEDAAAASVAIISAYGQGTLPTCMLPSPDDFRTAWDYEVDKAEKFNDPHNFTAIIGYEWTSLPGGNNLHRNILFRDNGKRAKKLLPATTDKSQNPETLWDWLEEYENTTGGQVFAIPHNGNLSNGLMFADTKYNDEIPTEPGAPMDQSYAERRQRWEPLYEVIQVKGAGETHPFLSNKDEFASFEIAGWDNGNLDLSAPETTDMYEHEYARAALKNGLKFEDQLGANPFKFGMVGSTDTHIGLSGMEEDNFLGKFPEYEPNAERTTHLSKTNDAFLDAQAPHKADGTPNRESCETQWENNPETLESDCILRFGWEYVASGYVGVWAKENTRKSLFDAMQRREVYATSGPRMTVRLFGGWDFNKDDLSRNLADVGYAKGVPMGSDLDQPAQTDKAPTFLVSALKDPLRGNLDRIQIVKGWFDGQKTHEQVYDVAWSGKRRLRRRTGKLRPVGNTVNTKTAEWTNTIGATELAQVWTDPDFDPTQRAFYYARVLEIPTPRWTDYDKVFFNETLSDDIPLTLQERVYTSPIWYSPAS